LCERGLTTRRIGLSLTKNTTNTSVVTHTGNDRKFPLKCNNSRGYQSCHTIPVGSRENREERELTGTEKIGFRAAFAGARGKPQIGV
jgi:hypothetical protein